MRNLPDIAESLLPIVERAGAAIMQVYHDAAPTQGLLYWGAACVGAFTRHRGAAQS